MKTIVKGVISVLIGICLSSTLRGLIGVGINSAFDLSAYLFFSILSLAALYFLLLSKIEKWNPIGAVFLAVLSLISSACFVLAADSRPSSIFWVNVISYGAILFVLLTPFLSAVQRTVVEKNHSYLFPAWLTSTLLSYRVTAFLANFHPLSFEIVLIALVGQAAFSLFLDRLLSKAQAFFRENRFAFMLLLALYSGLALLVASMLRFVESYPGMFDPGYFRLDAREFSLFLMGCVLALPIFMWLQSSLGGTASRDWRIGRFLDEHSAGLLLAGLFFCLYFIFVSVFNRPAFDVDNIFFDADGLLWRTRLTTSAYQDYYWRSVHPFALLLLRPPIKLIAMALNGDTLAAAFVFFALAGASCVFFSWMILKKSTGNSPYALLIAAILGISTAYLVFSSLFETYIFLGASLLLFYVVILDERSSLGMLVLAGLPTFGITLTNVGQSLIAVLAMRRDIKLFVKFGFFVGIISVVLALINNLIYRGANPLFFIPSAFETGNAFPASIERAVVVARTMVLHSIVAPEPLILKEEIPFLKVWFYRTPPLRLAEYDGLIGNIALFFWLALVVLGGGLFLKNLRRDDNRFAFSLLLCITFNFALHLRYGTEIFLYAANWTYAIVLFLGLAWREIADRRWFQVTLLVFLVLLSINNSRLLVTMLTTAWLHLR